MVSVGAFRNFQRTRSKDPWILRPDSTERWDIRKLVSFCTLNNIVQDKYCAMIAAFEDKHILIFRFLMVQYLIHFECHSLAWPHIRDFAKPPICTQSISTVTSTRLASCPSADCTFNGGMRNFTHVFNLRKGYVGDVEDGSGLEMLVV